MARVAAAEVEAEFAAIEAVVARHPEGVRRAALYKEFVERSGRALPERNFQRRLGQLIEAYRVRGTGRGASARYFPGPALVLTAPEPEPDYVPLSREGAQVRGLVRRPMIDRPPVGYDLSLLERYRPGRTWYLPRPLREHVHEIGRTPDAARPAGTYARDICARLLIDLSWASSRLEGNTYSRLDTQNLLEFGQRAEGTDATEALMILNHKRAIELLVDEAERTDFDRLTLFNLHAALSENLLSSPGDEGRLRTRVVQITGTAYHPPGIPQRIEQSFDVLLERARAIPDPFEQAFFAMVHLPYLQPFADVNKRTSRLAANIPLVKANLCPLAFVDVPPHAYVEGTLGVYELGRVDLLRDVFAWAYERSCAQYKIVREAIGEPDPVRLRYRDQLSAAVRDAVRGDVPPQRAWMRAWGGEHAIPAPDLDAFADRALALLVDLHEGALVRYGLRPSEFTAWRARVARPEPSLRRTAAPDDRPAVPHVPHD